MKIEVISDWIIKIKKGDTDKIPVSKAVEGDKRQEVCVTVHETDAGTEIKTAKLIVRTTKDGYVDIYHADGRSYCEDYRAERKKQNVISQVMIDLMIQEGHDFSEYMTEKPTCIMKQTKGDEAFYGLGDKMAYMNKRGYAFTNWNTDDPKTQAENNKSLYKSIPFFMVKSENMVYGLFFDTTFRSDFDFCRESEEYFLFESEAEHMEYYFIGGTSMKEVLAGYTYLTGTAPLPQLWTLGYHQSRWGYCCEADILEIVQQMKKNDIPCDCIHMDIDYMECYKVFTTNTDRFQNLAAMCETLKKDGTRIITIIDPGVKLEAGYFMYEEGLENSYFATDTEGETYVNAVWPGDSVYPDFGKKATRSWWSSHIQEFIKEHQVSGIWNDMNEPASFRGELPKDVVFYDEERKTNHAEMHNVYGHNMAKATYEGIKQATGKRPMVITRACYSGTQKYSIAWTGDNHSLWAHLQLAIPQLCSLGISGMPIVGTDVGGFGSDAVKELMCRWVQVGAFSPFFRNHSGNGTKYQEPWQFDQETTDIYRKYVKLRRSLLPYFYDCMKIQEDTGLPMMRPMVLNYENDPKCLEMNTQFMIGEKMLVAPVIDQGAREKMVYLPKGTWYDFWTKEKIEGGRFIIQTASLEECPVFVKAGSVIPMYPEDVNLAAKDQELLLKVFAENGTCLHYQDNGEDFAYQNGAYNLYRIDVNNGTKTITMKHEGYPRYQKITVID